MFAKKITDGEVKGKRVLVRVHSNVPSKDEKVGDDRRIMAAVPTLEYLIGHGAATILRSHLGWPKGKPDPQYPLQRVSIHLKEIVGRPVAFAEDCIGSAEEAAA